MKSIVSLSGCRTTRIYCRSGCPPGRRTLPKNRVYFASREEARAAGYRPCKVCRPDERLRETLSVTDCETPLGTYSMVSSRWGIVVLKPVKQFDRFIRRLSHPDITLEYGGTPAFDMAHQLDDYFTGRRRRFDLPLDLRGTPFRRRVWDVLLTIPWGETRSYGDVAAALGMPHAARAVGGAVGTNPLSIVVPCHRVIGSNGSLTGYGGGLDRKTSLLELEGIRIPRAVPGD